VVTTAPSTLKGLQRFILSHARIIAGFGLFSRSVPATISAVIFCLIPVAAQSAPGEPPEILGKVYHCKPGPWGELEYYQIYLEMPDYLVKLCGAPESGPRWSFPGGTQDSLRALCEAAALPGALKDYLLDPAHQEIKDYVLTVFPPVSGVIAMTREQRTVIYGALSKSELNVYHANPICILNGDPDTWFAQSGLRPELRELVKKMTYLRGDMLCFSDLSVLLSQVKPGQEARDVLKAMTRTRTLVLRLAMTQHSNLDEVMRYWSAQQRNKDVEAMLLSASEIEGGERLDCTHLLPPLARRFLYTYPSEELATSRADCHWTSLNFFAATPLDYHLHPDLFVQHVTEDYVMVSPPYSFGDVLMFMTSDGAPLHSCVYIADDIVYTKNGQNRASPWLLMKLGDVQRYYGAGPQNLVQGFRLKSEPNLLGK